MRSLHHVARLAVCLAAGVAALPGATGARTLSGIGELRASKDVRRVWRILGTVTMEQGLLPTAPKVLYIQDDSGGISVAAPVALTTRSTSLVEAEGTLHWLEDGEPELVASRAEVVGQGAKVVPRRLEPAAVNRGEHAGELVRVRATVLRYGEHNGSETLYFDEDPDGFRAYLRGHSGKPGALGGQNWIGATAEVTGIPMPIDQRRWQVRMRDSSDLAMLQPPPLVPPLYLWSSLAALTLLGLGVALWIFMLRRTVRLRTLEVEQLAKKAEESSQLKGEFLANLSHEIRTPLHGILGLQAVLLEAPMAPEQKETLLLAHQTSQHLLALLNDVLEFSRMEAVGFTLSHEPVELRELLSGLAASVGVAAKAKGLDLVLRAATVPQWVECDPTRLRQVLLNLLNNAVKFTEQGSVTLRADTVGLSQTSASVEFEVSDTGMGIPQEKQEMIFEAFRQLDGTIARIHGGSGLGLAIASRLVKKMGGLLKVKSRPGEGACFSFTLTFDVPQQVAPPALDPALLEQTPGRLRILVAEDNMVNQKLIRSVLHRDGHYLSVVESGDEAVAQASSGLYDLILMDVQMPGTDGLEATRAIRALNSPAARTPIVALTALGLAGDRERCLEAGMDDCLAKPFMPNDLLALIAKVSHHSQS